MKKMDLGGVWKLKVLGENVFQIPEEWMPAQVPGSVYSALLALDKMPDPYYRDNELQAVKLMENDFEYETTFVVEQELLDKDALFLCFDGVDTLADIYLNGDIFKTLEFGVQTIDLPKAEPGKVNIVKIVIIDIDGDICFEKEFEYKIEVEAICLSNNEYSKLVSEKRDMYREERMVKIL